MGQYLAVGIAKDISFKKEHLSSMELEIEPFLKLVNEQLYYDIGIYDLVEEDNYWVLNLKKEVLKEQLVPLLEKLYPVLYPKSNLEGLIAELVTKSYDELIEFADRKCEVEFQCDNYSAQDYITIDKPFAKRLSLNYSMISFAFEGKTFMETYGQMFRLFKYSIVNACKDLPLATALRMYITG